PAAGPRPPRRHVVQALLAKLESAETLEGVAPPRAVVHAVSHRFPVFPVARDVDADVPLAPHDILDRRSQLLLKTMRVDRSSGLARPIRLDQIVRARETSGVTGEDAIAARFHGAPPLSGAQAPSRIRSLVSSVV